MSDKTASTEVARAIKPKKRFLLKAIGILFALILLFVAGLWVWSGSQGSFSTALSFVQNRLPVKSLTVTDAQASLRNGGHFGNISIEQQDGSVITLHDVKVDWNLFGLLKKNLVIEELTIQKVHVMNAPAPESDNSPSEQPSSETTASTHEPPQQIVLPVQVNLKKLQIAQVVEGEKELEVASNIDLSYQFDGTKHALLLQNARFADGTYQGNASLTAMKPELEATLKGVLTTQVPQSNQNVTINADAKKSVEK